MKYNWSNLTINTFKKITDAFSFSEEEDERILRAAAILNGISYDDILEMPMRKTREMIEDTAFLYTEPTKAEPKKEYVLGNTTYVPMYKFDKMTTAQYIDYQAIADVAYEHLAEFMAIILIPKGHKYNDGYGSEDIIKEIGDNLTVEEALGLADFFVREYAKSTKRTMAYYEAMLMTQRIMTKDKDLKKVLKTTEKSMEKVRKALDSMFGSI